MNSFRSSQSVTTPLNSGAVRVHRQVEPEFCISIRSLAQKAAWERWFKAMGHAYAIPSWEGQKPKASGWVFITKNPPRRSGEGVSILHPLPSGDSFGVPTIRRQCSSRNTSRHRSAEQRQQRVSVTNCRIKLDLPDPGPRDHTDFAGVRSSHLPSLPSVANPEPRIPNHGSSARSPRPPVRRRDEWCDRRVRRSAGRG